MDKLDFKQVSAWFPKSFAFGSFSVCHYGNHLRICGPEWGRNVLYCVKLKVQTEMDFAEEGQEKKQEEREIFYFAMRRSISGSWYTLASQTESNFFFLFLTTSSQSEMLVFCSLSRASSRVSAHAFFSWNAAEVVEQLKHVRLLSSLEKEVLQDRNWRGWWRTMCVSHRYGQK